MRRLLISLALAAVAAPGVACAQNMVISFSEVGGNVVSTTSGSLNLAGLSLLGSGTASGQVDPSAGLAITGTGAFNFYSGLSGAPSFGSGFFTNADTSAGGTFGVDSGAGVLFAQTGYASFDPINSTSTYLSTSFNLLGLTQGAYSFVDGVNTITVQVGAAATPEPASWALMIGGFGVVGAAMRRRRKLTARQRQACSAA